MNNIQTEPSHPAGPLDVVTAFYSAVLSGDLDRARSALAPDAVLHVPGTHPLAGSHRGPDALLAFVAASRDLTGGSEQVELIDVLVSATRVAVYCRVTAHRGAAVLDNTTIHLVAVDGGLITGISFHNFDDVAVNEFWSAAA